MGRNSEDTAITARPSVLNVFGNRRPGCHKHRQEISLNPETWAGTDIPKRTLAKVDRTIRPKAAVEWQTQDGTALAHSGAEEIDAQ